MARAAASKDINPTRDDFAALLDETLAKDGRRSKARSSRARSSRIEKDFAIIDVGLKTEGRVPLQGVRALGGKPAELKVGDNVEVYLERIENALGEAVLSRDKARREESWTRLEKLFEKNEPVDGRHLRPRQGRLHRRPRRRRGLPAGHPGRHPPGARRRPADGPAAAVPDPQDGPPARQHRRLAPRRARRDPRRAAHRASSPASTRARSSTAWSRTSPTTARSWTSAASTACCTSPT